MAMTGPRPRGVRPIAQQYHLQALCDVLVCHPRYALQTSSTDAAPALRAATPSSMVQHRQPPLPPTQPPQPQVLVEGSRLARRNRSCGVYPCRQVSHNSFQPHLSMQPALLRTSPEQVQRTARLRSRAMRMQHSQVPAATTSRMSGWAPVQHTLFRPLIHSIARSFRTEVHPPLPLCLAGRQRPHKLRCRSYRLPTPSRGGWTMPTMTSLW